MEVVMMVKDHHEAYKLTFVKIQKAEEELTWSIFILCW